MSHAAYTTGALAFVVLLAGCTRLVQGPAADAGSQATDGAEVTVDRGPGETTIDPDGPSVGEAGEVPRSDSGPPGLYGPCPCDAPELGCVSGDSLSLCLRDCTASQPCAPDEQCQLSGSGRDYCVPACSADTPCPGGMHCTGFGTFPVDHCHPNPPRLIGEPCSGAALCAADHRCTGSVPGGPQRCYRACPEGGCPAAAHCVTTTLFQICLSDCDPLAPQCESYEFCWANRQLGEGICVPGPGVSGTCSPSAPCEAGTVCAAGACRTLCAPPITLCSGPLTCKPVPNSPWSACQP